jgi:hypothetical protein
MAQSGYTPIQLYRTSTASAVPLAANLVAGELAINTADVALFAENAAGTVTRIMNNPAGLAYPTADGTSGQLLTTNGSGTISFAAVTGTGDVVRATSPTLVTPVLGAASATSIANALGAVGTPPYTFTGDLNTGMWSPAADTLAFSTNGAEVGRLTSAGYLEAVYADKVVALGNSGTTKTIDLNLGNVFTTTLTGNCTFTLANSNANSSRGSSFTLILTNDATPGRSVAWAGGAFKFPGGAAALSRTTTANAVDIWVFFTPDNGTTYYGNISMKNMIA